MIHSPESLPDFPLITAGEITQSFLDIGIGDFRSAAGYVYRLPYGRNADRADYSLVLREDRGTCSTKHALLARLAGEQNRNDVLLTLGIYEMDANNTPGVGPVLDRYGLSKIPEAHCYLKHNGVRVDLTHDRGSTAKPIEHFLYEEAISPAGIGSYKTNLHERFLRGWSGFLAPHGLGWRELLSIREECIAALSG